MQSIQELIKERRQALSLTMLDVARAVGVSEGTISRWESGDIANMRRDKIVALARALCLSPAALMGWEEESPHAVPVPVLGRVRAGMPSEAVCEVLDYEDIPVRLSRDGDYFGLRIEGDSMMPVLCEGDTVIVRRQPDAENGDTAIVSVAGDDATVKRIRKTPEGIWLMPNNPSYQPLFYDNGQIESLPVAVLGVVVELRRRIGGGVF